MHVCVREGSPSHRVYARRPGAGMVMSLPSALLLRGVRQLALGTPSPPLCCSNQRQAAAQHLADMDSGDQDSGPQVCATSAFSTEPAQERRFFLKKGSLPPPAPSTPTPYSEIKMSEQEFKACKISSKVYIIISILPERILSLPLQALVPSYLFRNSGGQMCTDTSVRANWQFPPSTAFWPNGPVTHEHFHMAPLPSLPTSPAAARTAREPSG